MAAVVVAADNLRADNMDALTDVTGIGGGAGPGLEPDIAYQGATVVAAISRKVGTAQRGFYTTTGATRDMTAARRTTVIMKVAIGNWAALDPQTTPGLRLSVGSGPSDFYSYDQALFVNYPARGGFIFVPIDPGIASHRDGTTGTPVVSAADYFAIEADFNATSKAENVVMDAVDIGAGLNLTGGDGGDADGVFQDYVDHDEGTVGNRFAFVVSQEGIPFVLGRLWIGQNISQASVATEFTDSNKTVVFPDGLFAAGFSGLSFDLGNASTVVDISGCSFIGRGTTTGEDTRPTHTVTGTTGTATVDASLFLNFAAISPTSVGVYSSCTFEACGQITAAGADFSNSAVSNSTAASALLWNVATDTDGLLDGVRFTSAGTGHAIELGSNTPATINFNEQEYTGYAGVDGSTGNEVLYNNSGKAITINYTGVAPTVRNGAGASTTLVNTINYTITGLDQNAVVTIVDITTPTSPSLLFEETAGVDNVVTYAFDGALIGTAIGVYARNTTIKNQEFDDVLPAVDTSFPISQVADTVYI